jgi:RNA polymerase sigma factor (sigma-70 family)
MRRHRRDCPAVSSCATEVRTTTLPDTDGGVNTVEQVSDHQDDRDFEAVLAVVRREVDRYLKRRMSLGDAEEVSAETMRVLWVGRDAIPSGSEIPWSVGVARRVAANHHRGNRRRRALAERVVSAQRDDSARNDYPDLHEAMARLREDDREILRLWAWEGFDAAAIAIAEGCTPNTAAARLSRARKRLREEIDRQRIERPGHRGIDRSEGEHR